MEYPIPPAARTEAPPRPQQPLMERPRDFSALSHRLPILVILTLTMNFSCTVARLAIVGKLNRYWNMGVPALCNGAVTALPYGTLDADTAFLFEAVSNAVAVQTYGNNALNGCHSRDYSLGLSNQVMYSTFASLSGIGALDLIGTIVVQGFCWSKLFASRCKVYIFQGALGCGLILLALDVAAIYQASRTGRSQVVGLSVVTLIYTIVTLLLTGYVLKSSINRMKVGTDDLEVPDGSFTKQPEAPPTAQVPNRVMMFNRMND